MDGKEGQTYPVLADLGGRGQAHALRIAVGPGRVAPAGKVRPAGDFEPLPGGTEVLRPGFLTSLRINILLAVRALGYGASVVLTAIRWGSSRRFRISTSARGNRSA